MKKWTALAIASLGSLGFLVAGMAGCKQQVGERCQVDEDCGDSLKCNMGKDPPVCDESSSSSAIDALPPPDAPPDTTPG